MTPALFEEIGKLSRRPGSRAPMRAGSAMSTCSSARGMPEARALQCTFGDQTALKRIEDRMAPAGLDAGVQGTPSFFINGRKLDNPLPSGRSSTAAAGRRRLTEIDFIGD